MGECVGKDPLDTGDSGLLLPEERRFLLQVARQRLEAHIRRQVPPAIEDSELSANLQEKRAAFVTLRTHGHLRGCVGYPVHRTPLVRTVQENAVNAASRDPRFQPLTEEELPAVVIEISVFLRGDSPDRPFIRLADPSDLVLGRDGLFIEHACGFSGLLLPQVPIAQGWNVRPVFLATRGGARMPRCIDSAPRSSRRVRRSCPHSLKALAGLKFATHDALPSGPLTTPRDPRSPGVSAARVSRGEVTRPVAYLFLFG